jgi:putative Holliday junction resolvase
MSSDHLNLNHQNPHETLGSEISFSENTKKKIEGRILALDYGEKRIGVAVSDEDHCIAFPLERILNQAGFLSRIQDYITDYDIALVILGLPKTLNGSDSIKTKEVRLFHTVLSEAVTVPVQFEDERLSTVSVNKQLKSMGVSPSKKRDKIDSYAASIFLQTFLDRLRHEK